MSCCNMWLSQRSRDTGKCQIMCVFFQLNNLQKLTVYKKPSTMTWVQPNVSHLESLFNFSDLGNVFSSPDVFGDMFQEKPSNCYLKHKETDFLKEPWRNQRSEISKVFVKCLLGFYGELGVWSRGHNSASAFSSECRLRDLKGRVSQVKRTENQSLNNTYRWHGLLSVCL